MKKKLIIAVLALSVILMAAYILFQLVWNGVILLNNPSEREYPVRGVDVSHYQGDIDWPTLAGQGIDFAFIKATEGSGYVDPMFGQNMTGALGTPLRVGAYHFFSFESDGKAQAENFISTVFLNEDLLPPVIDFEFYGGNDKNPPDREAALTELRILVDELRAYYGKKPIIYATEEAYDIYIAGGFTDCDIWIRNVISRPSTSDGRSWTFWQYTNRGRLEGYSGDEKFIDMNVFYGDRTEFMEYEK